MFYSKFADDYEQIFPLNNKIYIFIKEYIPSANTTLLDIGCASGHYCGKFAADSYKITGIDRDSDMIATAINTYPDAAFKVLNLTDIASLATKWGLVYSTGNVMAHVSLDDVKKFLSSLKKNMPKDGIWIFQVINWDYILQRESFAFPKIETKDKLFLRHYSDITKNTLIFNTELKDKNSDRIVFKDRVTMYPVSSDKYISLHAEAGFELLGHFSDYGKSDFICNNFSADIYVFKLNSNSNA